MFVYVSICLLISHAVNIFHWNDFEYDITAVRRRRRWDWPHLCGTESRQQRTSAEASCASSQARMESWKIAVACCRLLLAAVG